MLYFFKLLPLLINIDSQTVLNWFGMKDIGNQAIVSNSDLNFESSTQVSLDTFRLIIEGLWEKIQSGLTLADIENLLFFILCIRFLILVIRYNLKTSFYITCIGLVAGYLWYRHLIDLIAMYRSVLIKLPFLHNLGVDAVQLRSMHRHTVVADLRLGDNVHWYNPGQAVYYAVTKGIINTDSETGLRYYIDPVSMAISKLPESNQSTIFSIYYKLYNKVIPKIYDICSKFWNQLSGVAAYAVITRIGKRYCPYLVRWHWTFLLIIGLIEQVFIYFIYRAFYFQTYVLVPQSKLSSSSLDPSLALQVDVLNGIITCVVLAHIGFIIFGLFHAIWGQYFYLPFFVENIELHVGTRPKTSLYSGGQTSWQDQKEKEKNLNRVVPKIWYGWFGRGTNNTSWISKIFKQFFQKVSKKIRKQFRR